MSRIDQLSIQGIRNFAPENPEVIKFEPPVTLILGKNGSGKTTIIECLKYATTGELPAGTDRGKNFIHDPHMTTKKMSIGSVKLQFYDEQKKKHIVARSMEARFLKSKLDFKTTDGTISLVHADGKELTSHKKKNDDLNTHVCNMLGVSKALINNVLFCHQEDSNWPLDTAQKVKEKFDDIFNTTRYVKCQDEIRKQIKEVKDKMKDIDTSVNHYKLRKELADGFRDEVRGHNERRVTLQGNIQQLERDKTELETKLNRLQDQYREAEKIKNAIATKELKLEELKRNREDLEREITRVISDSAVELENQIKKFQNTKAERERERTDLKEDEVKLDNDLKKCAATQQEKLVCLGKLKSEEEQHNRRMHERDNLLVNLARRFQWPGSMQYEHPLSADRVSMYQNHLKDALKQAKQAESDTKKRLDDEEHKLIEAKSKIRDECVRLQQDMLTKKNAIYSLEKELDEVTIKLGDLESNSRQLSSVERKQKDAQAQVEQEEKQVNVNELKDKIDHAKREKNQHEDKLNDYRSQLKRAISERDARLKVEMLKKDLNSKMVQENRLKGRETVIEAVQLLLGSSVESQDNLLSYYNSKLTVASQELSASHKKLTTLGHQLATNEADLRNVRKQLEQKQADLSRYQQKLKDGGTDISELENVISKLQQELKLLENNHGMWVGSENTYRSYTEKMEKLEKDGQDVNCPLCSRQFDEPSDARDLIDELKDRMKNLPTKIADLEKNISEKKERHGSLLQLRPLAESAEKLIKTEIPQLQAELKRLEESSNAWQKEQDAIKLEIQVLKRNEEIGKAAHSEVIQLNTLQTEVKKLKTEVDRAQRQLGSSSLNDNLSVDELQEKVEIEEGFCRDNTKEIESLNDRCNRHQSKLADLKERANRLMEEQLRLSNNLQQRGTLMERKELLEVDIDQARSKLEQSTHLLEPYLSKQKNAENDHIAAQKKRDNELDQARKKIDELQDMMRQIESFDKEIERWSFQGKEAELERSKQEVDRLDREKSSLEQRKLSVQRQISNLEQALINTENEERNLRNNLRLLLNARERDVVHQAHEELKAKLAGFNIRQLVTDIKANNDQLDTYKIRLGSLSGQYQEVEKNIVDIEAKLRREEYATAGELYLEKVREFEAHFSISEDLANFYNALESALMKFHKERMNIINRMIREMWHSTYKGKDIDYVEIQADPSKETGSARRQYNYRVVMVKSGVEMDMRGRCSAGQKVLASLLIRMALAEAFSSKCGVLALDEPTTNLDEDNIASLSDTILELSNSFTRQKRNFQLIIITHDEKFLERMSRDKRMEKYYRVDRNRFNLSQIREFDVMGGLQTVTKKDAFVKKIK